MFWPWPIDPIYENLQLFTNWAQMKDVDGQNPHHGNACLFDFYYVPEKLVYRSLVISCILLCFGVNIFQTQLVFPKTDPEVSGSGRGASPTHRGPFLSHSEKKKKIGKTEINNLIIL